MTVQLESDISVTKKAASQIKQIMAENNVPENSGLRVGIKGGGCSGLQYTMGFEESSKEGDTIIEQEGVKLFVDGKSLFYLGGTVLDFTDGLNGRGFVFDNPNAKKTCGCGESFSV